MSAGLRQKLEVLQVGRGYAAFAVLALHALLATRDFIGQMPSPLEWIVSQGYLGVDFFFVLSGFIILQVHGRDSRTFAAARSYVRKRATRIYVPYLPIGVAMVLLYRLAPHISAAPRDWSLLTSLTLLPTGKPPALSVAWTLVHEVTFYAIFLLFYATRRFGWIMAGWGVALVGVLIVKPDIQGFWGAGFVQTVFDPINIEFLFGMAVGLCWPRISEPLAWPLVLLGALGCAACIEMHVGETYREAFGLTVGLLVVGLVALEGRGAIRSWPRLVALGDASYALYLIHVPVISLVVRGARAAHLSWWASLLLCVVASLIAGFAYNRLFENPMRRLLAKRLDARPRPARVAI